MAMVLCVLPEVAVMQPAPRPVVPYNNDSLLLMVFFLLIYNGPKGVKT